MLQDEDANDVDLISGEKTYIATSHTKGIVPLNGNAKIISSNDKEYFTYRGRFIDETQAAQIGYISSQKAHSALRWLIAKQGTQAIYGGRVFICWNPKGKLIQHVCGPFAQFAKPIKEPAVYNDELRKFLVGCKAKVPDYEDVVIAAFDAATSGRLAVTYYSELTAAAFFKRMYQWDQTFCWPHGNFGIQSPKLKKVVDAAFGTEQGEFLKTDDRVLRLQMQRLLTCRLDGAPFPKDIVDALVYHASTPLSYNKSNRDDILVIACAAMRKYYLDRFGEEWKMVVEPEKKDRSYQFGRLLAIMEKVERDTYKDGEKREPNAIRQQAIFRRRPLYCMDIVMQQLETAYFPQLNPGSRIYYKNLIGQIMEQINAFPQEEWNKPLSETYLMGYYLQRQSLDTKKEVKMEEE